MAECVFCRQLGRTREHILPLAWLLDVLPSEGPYEYLVHRYDQGEIDNRVLEMRKPEFVTRRVCAACNNGWMNDLDHATQPLLTRLLNGEQLTITRLADVALLASWTAKIAILTDAAQGAKPALAPDHSHHVYEHRAPPPGWLMWIAHADPQEHATAALNGYTMSRPLGLGFVATVLINQLVLQALVLPPREPPGTHPFHAHAIKVWPPTYRTIHWPPPHSLSPNGVVRFAESVVGVPMRSDKPHVRIPMARR